MTHERLPHVQRQSTIAIAQMTSTHAQDDNMRAMRERCVAARAAGCSALFLPEGFSFIGLAGQDGLAVAQPLDGALIRELEALAKEFSLFISCGGFPEESSSAGRRFNTHVMISPDGGRVGEPYRKTHLFDIDIDVVDDDGTRRTTSIRESDYTVAGDALVSHATPMGNVGVSICYDLRFPYVYERLRFEHNADIIIVPSAFTTSTGKAHWETLLRARAIETQCYVVAAAQVGRHNERRVSYGHGMVVDPWGTVIAEFTDAYDDDDEGHPREALRVCTIDLDVVDEARTKIPLAAHRRPFSI